MDAKMESLQKEVQQLRREVDLLKEIVQEDFPLSDETKHALHKACKTPKSAYVDLE